MGYRSNVVLAMSEPIKPYFLTLMATNPKAKKFIEEADVFASSKIEEGDFVVAWNGVKWYPSYDEVEAIINFVFDLENHDLSDYGAKSGDIQWEEELFKFIRIGEDHGDVDVIGTGFWDLMPVTKIGWP